MHAVVLRRALPIVVAIGAVSGCSSKPSAPSAPPAVTAPTTGEKAPTTTGAARDSDALGPRAPGELGNEQPPK